MEFDFNKKEQKPEWEEYEMVGLHRGGLTLKNIAAKIKEGWELVAVVNIDRPYYYFRKVK